MSDSFDPKFPEFDEFDDDDAQILTLTDEETGEDIEFMVIDKVEYEGSDYCLVVEMTDVGENEDEEPYAAIFKVETDEDGDTVYFPVEDDDEFEAVSTLFEAEGDDDFDFELIDDDGFDDDDDFDTDDDF